jgi:isobutyryl-CoA mutase
VLGITGTGGAGKSSLTDELVRRFCGSTRATRCDRRDLGRSVAPQDRRRAARRPHPHERHRPWPNVYMRSLATRDSAARSPALPDAIAAAKAAGFDLVVVETSGIGQGDAAIVPLVDVSLYVMTPEFGAASQLEKIDMLDFADFVAINKFDRRGAEDALRDVRKQVQRNRQAFGQPPERCRSSAPSPPLQRRRRDRALPGAAAEKLRRRA